MKIYIFPWLRIKAPTNTIRIRCKDVSQLKSLSPPHWLINYVDTKAKCRHLKSWPVCGLCGRCLSQFINSQSCWYFRPSFVNCCLSNLSFLSPPSLPCVKVQYIQTVCVWVVGRCWVLLETVFCRSWTLCFWPDSEPTKLLDRPKQKTRRGEGLRQINTCRKVPLQSNFFKMTTFCFGIYIVNN